MDPNLILLLTATILKFEMAAVVKFTQKRKHKKNEVSQMRYQIGRFEKMAPVRSKISVRSISVFNLHVKLHLSAKCGAFITMLTIQPYIGRYPLDYNVQLMSANTIEIMMGVWGNGCVGETRTGGVVPNTYILLKFVYSILIFKHFTSDT
jgi:hypothetical protein